MNSFFFVLRCFYFRKIVRFGEHDKNKNPDCDESDPDDIFCADKVKDVIVSRFFAHPEFSQKTKFNDIGLVKVVEAANFKSRSVKPICLPFTVPDMEFPKKLIVTGWGKVSDNRLKHNGILQQAVLPYFDREDCRKLFMDYFAAKNINTIFYLNDNQFCAGGDGESQHSFLTTASNNMSIIRKSRFMPR